MLRKEPIDINDLTVEDCLELVAGISNFKFSRNKELADKGVPYLLTLTGKTKKGQSNKHINPTHHTC